MNSFRIVYAVLAALVCVAACSKSADDREDKLVYTTVPTDCFNGYRESVKEIAGPEFEVEDSEDMYQTANTMMMGNAKNARCNVSLLPNRNGDTANGTNVTSPGGALHMWAEYYMVFDGVNKSAEEDASAMLSREFEDIDQNEISVVKVGDEAVSWHEHRALQGDDRVPRGRAVARLDNMVVAADVTGAFGDPEVVASYDLGDLEERAVKLLYATVEHLEPA